MTAILGTGAVVSVTAQDAGTYAVSQGGACTEVTPLGDGSRTVSEYYDYRTMGENDESYPSGYDSSYGTTDVQESQVSQLFLYRGSEGVSLVALHDELYDGSGGGAITFRISGLPADGEWAVEDDDYVGRDDNFNHSGTSSKIDWMWAPNRTDGAAFRGVGSTEYDRIRIDPAFSEESWAYQERDPRWPMADDDLTWVVRDASGETTPLDTDDPVEIRRGTCSTSPPNASIEAPGSATVGEEVTFDASGSTDDRGIVEYRWDVDGDGEVEATTDESTYVATYDGAGNYTATVTVEDGAGQTDTATTTVNVTDETAPTADITRPERVTANESATFSGSNSTDDDAIASYEWSFGDGTNATGETVEHTYTSEGTFDVTLTVADPSGNTDAATETVNVTDPDLTPPNASVTAPAAAEVDQQVTLDASGSTDNREIREYRWDVDGDGEVDNATETAVYETRYDSPGNRTVRVTVVDEWDNTDTATTTVNVTDTTPPTLEVEAPSEVTVSESATFSASNSTDNDAVASVGWSFGDGTNATGETVEHTYTSNGTYDVTVTATDPSGNAASETVTVNASGPDTTPPTARLDAPTEVEYNATVDLDASASADDRGIVEYRWDVDGDGEVDDATANATHSARYTDLGNATIRLTVVDAAGNENTTTATLRVVDTTPPDPAVDAPESPIEANASVTFSASNTTDAVGVASYEWSFGDGTNATGETVEHTYTTNGTYDVTLTAADSSGNAAEQTVKVGVGQTVTQPDDGSGGDDGGSGNAGGGGSNDDDRSGSAGGGSGGGGSGGGGASLPPPVSTTETTVRNASADGFTVTVTDPRVGEPAGPVDPTLPGSVVGVDDFLLRPASSEDIRVRFDVSTDVTNATPPTADATLATVRVATETGRVRDGSFTLELAGSALEDLPARSRVVLLSARGSNWSTVAERPLDSTTGTVAFDVNATGTDRFAVAVRRPNLTVREFTLNRSSTVVGQPVRVSVAVENVGHVTAGRNLTVIDGNESLSVGWVTVPPGETGRTTGTVSFATNGTRELVVGERRRTLTVADREPTIELVEVRTDPSTVGSDEPVTIEAVVRNDGTAPGTYTARFELFGEVVAERDVSVPPGETRTVGITQRISAPGTYTARVENRTTELTIEAAGDATATPVRDGGPWPGGTPAVVLGVGTLAAVILGGWGWRRR